MTGRLALIALAATGAVGGQAAAAPGAYPPPSHPHATDTRPRGPFVTHRVCREGRRRGCLPTVQAAVDAAAAGDRVLVPAGVHPGPVEIAGPAKRHLRLVGDPRRPGRVVIAGGGVLVRRAAHVAVRGLTVRDSDGIGLRFERARGGTVADVVVAGHAVAGVSVERSPAVTRPARVMVRRLRAERNAVGLRGVRVRALTVDASRFAGNAIGIALMGARDVVVAGSAVLANNAAGFAVWPVGPGVGVLLRDAAGTVLEDTRIAGHERADVDGGG